MHDALNTIQNPEKPGTTGFTETQDTAQYIERSVSGV